jgi:hypothetical protein
MEQIQHLFRWSQQHLFLQTVIVSPAALQRNWDQMMEQLMQNHNRLKGQVYPLPSRRAEGIIDLTKGEA